MRKIKIFPIIVFISLFLITLSISILIVYLGFRHVDLGNFHGLCMITGTCVVFYLCSLTSRHFILRLMPLHEGNVVEGSLAEFSYSVYLLYHLMLFDPIIRSGILPQSMLRLLYLMLGARLGSNTYGSGIIYDPIFVRIGKNSLLGHDSLIIPHVIENDRLAHYSIHIGDNVTIGAHSIIMAGVTIGNDSLVAAGAIVTKGTQIGSGEVWGGVPACLLKRKNTRIKAATLLRKDEINVERLWN